jgi:LysM repeat protein
MLDRRGTGGCRSAALALIFGFTGMLTLVAEDADAAVAHVVAPGETLWSIAAANNLTTRTVAVFNGLPEDAMVVEGQTVNVPTVDEGAAALAAAGTPVVTDTASDVSATSGVDHVVVAGESLSSVAAANGTTVESLAAANGLATDAFLIEGETISVPAASASSSTVGLGHIPSPYGELHLDPAAADSWNRMRDDSVTNYGVDLHPAGPVSAYRTYEEQAELYELYLSGQGAPANPPGTSSHETGSAVDVADPSMRDVIDQIGGAYGWSGTIPSEWWHVQYGW